MDATQRRGSPARMRYIQRFTCWIVSAALAFCLLGQPPKAKAFVGISTVVVAAACFLTACGVAWSVVDSANSDGFQSAVDGLLGEFAGTKGFDNTDGWINGIGGIDGITVDVAVGALIFSHSVAVGMTEFVRWVVGKFGLTAGGDQVVIGGSGDMAVTVVDGVTHIGGYPVFDSTVTGSVQPSFFVKDLPYSDAGKQYVLFSSFPGTYIDCTNVRSIKIVSEIGKPYSCDSNAGVQFKWSDYQQRVDIMFGTYFGGKWTFITNYNSNNPLLAAALTAAYLGGVTGDIALAPGQALDIPTDADLMDETKEIAVSVGATGDLTQEELLQQILDAILTGQLDATKEIVAAPPVPGEITDVDDLGLPALADVITTKFPFSIPWDVVRGIKLVAAPPEAPCWSVDFLAPIEHRVGAWAGDTTITFDMAEFPLVGQVIRWTSTIGFCLMLAMGTKKLVWVA